MVKRRTSKNSEIFGTTKYLLLLNSFLRSDKKISELGHSLIKKAESAPDHLTDK